MDGGRNIQLGSEGHGAHILLAEIGGLKIVPEDAFTGVTPRPTGRALGIRAGFGEVRGLFGGVGRLDDVVAVVRVGDRGIEGGEILGIAHVAGVDADEAVEILLGIGAVIEARGAAHVEDGGVGRIDSQGANVACLLTEREEVFEAAPFIGLVGIIFGEHDVRPAQAAVAGLEHANASIGKAVGPGIERSSVL